MSFRGHIDQFESCGFGCPHHGPGSCRPCEYVYYSLSPDLCAERNAEFVGVCDECGGTKYLTVLPHNAKMGIDCTAQAS